MDRLGELLTSTWIATAVLPAALLYGTALIGALLMYFFASSKGLEGTVPKLKLLMPGKSDTFYYRCDFLFVIVLGPVVGLICYRPGDTFQALAAGFSWVAALNILTQKKIPEQPAANSRSPGE